jgi:hypothetical protein
MCRLQVSFTFHRQKACVISQSYFVTIQVRRAQLFLYIHNLQTKTAHVQKEKQQKSTLQLSTFGDYFVPDDNEPIRVFAGKM